MKKLFYLFVLTFSISLSVNSQITLEKKGSSNMGLQKVTFTNYGDKYYTFTFHNNLKISDTIIIYNSDWSVFRTVVNSDTSQRFLVDYIPYPFIHTILSDNLFNNDGLIEYIVCKPTYPGSNFFKFKIMNELGNIVYTLPDSNDVYIGRILKMDNSFKLQIGYGDGSSNLLVYSLPGTLPCDPCGSLSGLVDPQNGGGISELRVNPNPFNSSLEINYEFLTRQDNPRLILTDILGRELKSISLSNQSDRINLNTSDLPKGTIIISLIGSGQNVISKKVIKIE